MALLDSILGVEGTSQNPNSSAVGPGQFINSTWLDMIRKYRPDLAGLPQDQILALRTTNPQLAQEMTAQYAKDNQAYLTNHGFEANPGNTYLAHFLGPQGATTVLGADPNAPLSKVINPKALSANPFLQNWTVGQLENWAAGKMGAPAQPAPINVASLPPPQAQAPQLPPAAPQPQQQQQQQAQPQLAGGGASQQADPLQQAFLMNLMRPQAQPMQFLPSFRPQVNPAPQLSPQQLFAQYKLPNFLG